MSKSYNGNGTLRINSQVKVILAIISLRINIEVKVIMAIIPLRMKIHTTSCIIMFNISPFDSTSHDIYLIR